MTQPLLLGGIDLARGPKIYRGIVALSLDELVEEGPCHCRILPRCKVLARPGYKPMIGLGGPDRL